MSQFFEEFNDDVEASVLKTKKCQLPGFCLHQLVPRFCFGTTLFPQTGLPVGFSLRKK